MLNNKIASLAGTVASADGRPTAPSYAVFRVLSAQLDTQLVALKAVLATDIPKLNAMLRAAGQPEIVPRAVEPPAGEAGEADCGNERDGTMMRTTRGPGMRTTRGQGSEVKGQGTATAMAITDRSGSNDRPVGRRMRRPLPPADQWRSRSSGARAPSCQSWHSPNQRPAPSPTRRTRQCGGGSSGPLAAVARSRSRAFREIPRPCISVRLRAGSGAHATRATPGSR